MKWKVGDAFLSYMDDKPIEMVQKFVMLKKIMDFNYQLNTLGWAPGVYIIRVVVGDEVLTDKITVGK